MTSWLQMCNLELEDGDMIMQTEHVNSESGDLLQSWLELLKQPKNIDPHNYSNINSENEQHIDDSLKNEQFHSNETRDDERDDKSLPRHVEMIKSILEQVVKFINSSDQRLQILSLECLVCGLPLLKNYENELLPLVHLIWSPFVEKFRQRNALVLNRCFSLLEVIAMCSKDFITKRSLE